MVEPSSLAHSPEFRANFAVYKAKDVERTFVVASTSASRDGTDAPSVPELFVTGDALDALVAEIGAASAATQKEIPMIIRVHGYNTRRWDFERYAVADADPARDARGKSMPSGFDPQLETFRPGEAFYVGFRWPSEGLFSGGSVKDTLMALFASPLIGTGLFLLPLLALLSSHAVADALRSCAPWLAWLTEWLPRMRDHLGEWLATAVPAATRLVEVSLWPYREAVIASLLFGAGLLFLGLRLSTYSRDRYRALHYGVPDFGEFLRTLEDRLGDSNVSIRLHVVGHSMGSLLLVNAFRVMSDYFHAPRQEDRTLGRFGTFQLGRMILCAADIPVVMATPDHNNYFLSALRRFEAVHVFSSDRDVILKWLSLLANWMSEPRFDMAGRKLGNVLLARAARPGSSGSVAWALTPMTRPVMRNFRVYPKDSLPDSRRSEPLYFYDCSSDPSVAGSSLYLSIATVIVIGLVGWLSTWVCRSATTWLFVATAVLLGLGLICRLLWPWVRDRTGVGSVCGLFADWTAILIFLPLWFGWNPHGGYFLFGWPPRRTISALLRGEAVDQTLAPTLRYQKVRLSV